MSRIDRSKYKNYEKKRNKLIDLYIFMRSFKKYIISYVNTRLTAWVWSIL